MNNHYLVVDISNIAHMCRHQHQSDDINTHASMTVHVVLNMLRKYHKKYNPTKMILAFDNTSWRKDYTLSDKCISKKIYKGNRNLNLTQRERELLDHFRETLSNFEQLIKEHTGIIHLSAELCEADDLIAAVCQKYGNNNKITILSTDKDFVQLLTHSNIKLMNPVSGKYRTLEEYDHDINWHKFFVNIRAGDDNIQSAYPRVRKTRLKNAYEDEFEMVNLLNETWTDHEGTEFVVGELYKENCLLKNLDEQPEHIKKIMFETVEYGIENPGKYSHFKFLKFCGDYQLNKIAEQIDSFIPLLK